MFHRIWESSVTGSNEFANYKLTGGMCCETKMERPDSCKYIGVAV